MINRNDANIQCYKYILKFSANTNVAKNPGPTSKPK